ncbi:MAG: hypothetical protein D6738_03030 [Acidobacteria bacterium]|nr:MAG: hypothetical protein D6738_03030 [Acidobacteriota bacterium]
MNRSLLPTLTLLVLVLPICPVLATEDTCPVLTVPTIVFDSSSGEFHGMRPTSNGNLLFCGRLVRETSTDMRLHFAGSSTVFWLTTAAPSGMAIRVTLDLPPYGRMIYDLNASDGTRTLVSSTVADCAALGEDPLLDSIEETYRYVAALVFAQVGTQDELDAYGTLFQLLGEFVNSPDLLADCFSYLVKLYGLIGGCADTSGVGCDRAACGNCCSDWHIGKIEDCYDAFRTVRQNSSWFAWLLGGWHDASNDLEYCYESAHADYHRCQGQCDVSNRLPECDTTSQ